MKTLLIILILSGSIFIIGSAYWLTRIESEPTPGLIPLIESSTNTSTVQWRTYSNSASSLSFKYPETLSLTDSYLPHVELTDKYNLNINLSSPDLNCSIIVNPLPMGIEGYGTSKSEEIHIDSIKTTLYTNEYIPNEDFFIEAERSRLVTTSLRKADDDYIIFCTFNKNDPAQKNLIDKILKTIRLSN